MERHMISDSPLKGPILSSPLPNGIAYLMAIDTI